MKKIIAGKKGSYIIFLTLAFSAVLIMVYAVIRIRDKVSYEENF